MLVNLARAYDVMDKYKLDGLVAALPINVYYLTDFWSPMLQPDGWRMADRSPRWTPEVVGPRRGV